MTTQEILFTVDQHVATVTFNRPDSLNSLSLEVVKDLLALIRRISNDRDIRALVLTGTGRGFCTGWQLGSTPLPGLPDESFGVSQAHLMEEYFNPVITELHDLSIPIVAAVNGVTAGAGVSLALAADVAIAAASANFVLTFAPKLGNVPDLGATRKLPRLIGWGRTQAATLLGDKITAADAAAWGMVWRCVADEELAPAVLETARRLAAGPPGIAREVRHAHHAACLNGLAEQLDYERQRQKVLLDRRSFREGLAAFAEKRAPDFYRG